MTRSAPRLARCLLWVLCSAGITTPPAAAGSHWRAAFIEGLRQWPDDPLRKGELHDFKELVDNELECGSSAPDLDLEDWLPSIASLNHALQEHPEDGELVRVSGSWWDPYLPQYYLALAAFRLGCYEVALDHLNGSLLNRRVPIRGQPQKERFDALKYLLERWLQVHEPPPGEGCKEFRDPETESESLCPDTVHDTRGPQ